MQITQHTVGDALEFRLTGRVDATWAEHLNATIENAVRGGAHRVVLNFTGVDYISSLGIRVLLAQHKLLHSIKGSLAVTNPNPFVRELFDNVGLSQFFLEDAGDSTPASAGQAQTRGNARYELYPQQSATPLICSFLGNPALLAASGFTGSDCRTANFPTGTFGLGLGAFGSGFADCSGRFGEFLAVSGAAITQPTGSQSAQPDYVVEQGSLIPRVETLYAITGAGDFSTMARFDAPSGKLPLSELIESLLAFAAADSIAFALLAETEGIVGAALHKSPANQPLAQQLPAVRDWLSFTTERIREKSLALVAGVASSNAAPEAAPFLRPIKAGSPVQAHIHAAVFPYRPVQRGELKLTEAVPEVLSILSPASVLHLMADTRPFEGVGETDLARGACWFGPIQSGPIQSGPLGTIAQGGPVQ